MIWHGICWYWISGVIVGYWCSVHLMIHWAFLLHPPLFSLCVYLYLYTTIAFNHWWLLNPSSLSPTVSLWSCLPPLSFRLPLSIHSRWLALPSPGSARVFFLSKGSFFFLPTVTAHIQSSDCLGFLTVNVRYFLCSYIVPWCDY